jgi:hypothetical protein
VELISKIQSRYTMEDVAEQRAIPVSVITEEDLEATMQSAIDAATADLTLRLQQAEEQLANAEAGGGLEEAAADAALEAEALALEAKAQADQRATVAESRVVELEEKIAALEAAAGDAANAAELEAKVTDLEAQIRHLQEEVDRVPTLVAEIEELRQMAEDEVALADAGPVTDADRKSAQRLAEAFLEEVFSDDEDKTNAAIKDGKFREVFERDLKIARKKYVKRVKAHVRADTDYWEDTLTACEAKEW